MKKSDPPVVVKQTYAANKATVWQAITDPARMRKWYFNNIPDFKPEVGFETEFLVTNEGREFPHLWKVTAVAPEESITYDWKYRGYPGDMLVTFALQEIEEGTELTLTATVREDFPDDIPEFRREACVGGWEYFIQQSLKEYLEP